MTRIALSANPAASSCDGRPSLQRSARLRRIRHALASAGLVIVGASLATCGGGEPTAPTRPAPPPPPPPNRAPTAVGTLPAVRVAVGESSDVQLSGGFSDPDGDVLSYSAVTSNSGVATVSVAASVATVTGVAKGVATISVTATDPGGGSARQVFEVTVPNRAPETSGTIAAIELSVGETETLDVSQYFADPDGDALSYSVASSDTTSATGAASGNAVTVTAVGAGTATITVTATDPDAARAELSFDVTVPNRAPEPTDSIPDQELAVGDSAVFDLEDYFHDPDGDTLSYASESSDETVTAVSVSGSTLAVRALAKGSATISVTVADRGGLSVGDSFDVTVPNRAPVVTDTIPAERLTVGEVREWAGSDYFADLDGDALTYAAGTTDASIVLAIVSGGDFGIVAVSPGTATVTVTATDGDRLSASQSFRVTVQGQAAVIISGVEPAVLLERASATIRGSGFSIFPANNAVLIDGLPATVTAASPTSLSVVVPFSDCLPPRRAQLSVTVLSLSDARTVGVTPRTPEDLALPLGFYRYSFAGNGCLHLPGDASGGEYIIGVVSTSEVPSSLTPVTMTSILGDATVLADAPAVAAFQPLPRAEGVAEASAARIPPTLPAAADGTEVPLGQEDARSRRNWERHNQAMAANQELLRSLGPIPPSVARARQARALVVNDTISLFATPGATCEARDQVRAVVRLDGNNAVWLEDIDNPSGTFAVAELEELDAFYAARVQGVHDDYYGGLSDIDGNGKVLILLTKEANRANLRGWVWAGDLYPSDWCASSNQAEIFFGRVPDPDGVFGAASTRQQTLDSYRSLLAHEITHIVQFNAVVFGEASFTKWELEGGATLAEQLVAYRLFGHGSGQNLGHAAFQRGGDWYSEWVVGLARFFGWDTDDPALVRRVPNAPEQCSWLGSPKEGNDGPCRAPVRAVYDVPSLVLRYAMDRWGGAYPGGERALMRRLSQSPELGLASLAEVSQWSFEQILADFYITLWLDLNGWEAYGMTTWDLAHIWSQFREATQLRPWVSTSAAFRGNWSVRAGSTFYLHWGPRGARGPTSLKVTSPSGAPVPGHISVWALRIR